MPKIPAFSGCQNPPVIAVVPCGSAKQVQKCPAGEMYLGSYHAACRRFAGAWVKAHGGEVLILSAKYGLLGLADLIEPYELRMGKPGCVTATFVLGQAESRGLLAARHVLALGGRDYTRVCEAIWPHCATPLAGVGGIGKQLRWLKENLNAASQF